MPKNEELIFTSTLVYIPGRACVCVRNLRLARVFQSKSCDDTDGPRRQKSLFNVRVSAAIDSAILRVATVAEFTSLGDGIRDDISAVAAAFVFF